MLTPGETGILIAVLSLVGVIYNANSTRGKVSKVDTVLMENRITVIEKDVGFIRENMMTRKDRDLLVKLDERVCTLMNTLAAVIPKNLKNPPELDSILDTLSVRGESGWTSVVSYVCVELTPEIRLNLFDYLESQTKSRSKQRRLWAGLYLALLMKEIERESPEYKSAMV